MGLLLYAGMSYDMKISEVVQKTNVSKQAIHHYINEGFLPKPVKKGKMSAEYDEQHVSQLRLIKELRENYFLPLAVIKDVIRKNEKRPASERSLFDVKARRNRPLDWLLEEMVVGKEAYMTATGIDPVWLDRMEERGVISPEVDGDELVYSSDDVLMGKLIVEMGENGIGSREGFDPEALADLTGFLREAVEKTHEQFVKPITDKMSVEERVSKSKTITDLMGMFFYCMNRKISC
jgi:DNA-binding transcriptional MerR regulator